MGYRKTSVLDINVDTPSAQVASLLADAAEHYRNGLRASPATVDYLRRRGTGGSVAGRFGLGFARARWDDLSAVCARYGEETVLASGLVVVTGEGADGRRYDRFRDRVMFPIRTADGAVAGFGGRVLDGALPKYINSPEGVTFKKRELLYGLFEARAAIAAEGMALLVEGYFDVVALVQAGFAPVVGSLGTACGSAQIRQLLTVTRQVVFCFDGDDAGRRAAHRAMESVLPLATDDVSFQFVFLPKEHDPDSYVRSYGLDRFKGQVAGAVPLLDLLLATISDGCDSTSIDGRVLCSARAQPLWLGLANGDVRDRLLASCALVLGYPVAEVRALWLETRCTGFPVRA